MDTAIGIIGHAATGKTALAQALAEAIDGADIASFGDAVRERAAAAGMDPSDRKVLMRLGQNWVDTDVEDYCRAVLGQQTRRTKVLIIEGIRHETVHTTLKELLAPIDFASVLLKAPYDVLVERMVSQRNLRTNDVQKVLNDPTETEVDQLLLGAADLILDATESVSYNVREVLDWLAERQRRASGEKPVDYLGSFDPEVFDADERADLINAVSAEFDMPLMKEFSERVGVSKESLVELRDSRHLLALEFGEKLLIPGFQLRGDQLDADIAHTVELLSAKMTSWEILAWMVSNSGLLDGLRPLDLPRESLPDAARQELNA